MHELPLLNSKVVALVSHDAGGAEIISSLQRRESLNAVFALAGPALAIFNRKLGTCLNLSIFDAVARADFVLCGTSWPSEFELKALQIARQLGKPTASFLDHWINFADRFERRGDTTLPDEIWVGDIAAQEIALRAFPTMPIRVIENPYLLDMQEALQAASPNVQTPGTVLYVCEPTSEHALMRFGNARYWGYTEQEALRYFLSRIGALGPRVRQVVVRPHPSERADKYAWAIHEARCPLVVRADRLLVDEIAAADTVVGCNSMAMIAGLWGGKHVLCSIPPGGADCTLPQDAIAYVRDLHE